MCVYCVKCTKFGKLFITKVIETVATRCLDFSSERPKMRLAAVRCPVVDACSMPQGWTPPTMTELIDAAREVLYARVRRTFPDETGRPWSENLYTAEVEVFCIMKGQRTPPIINVTDIGLFLIGLHSHFFIQILTRT